MALLDVGDATTLGGSLLARLHEILHVAPNVEVCGAARAARNEAWSSPPRPTPPLGYVSLELIPRDIESPVEDTKDIDIAVVLYEVCDPVVPIEQHSDVAR